MNEFEKEIIEKLARIEGKADQYITWRTVALSLAGIGVALVGIFELQMNRLDKRFQTQITEASKKIIEDVGKDLDASTASLTQDLKAAVANDIKAANWGVGTGNYPLMKKAYGSDGAYQIDLNAGGKIKYWNKDRVSEIEAYIKGFESSIENVQPVRSLDLDSLYVRDSEGTFRKAFP